MKNTKKNIGLILVLIGLVLNPSLALAAPTAPSNKGAKPSAKQTDFEGVWEVTFGVKDEMGIRRPHTWMVYLKKQLNKKGEVIGYLVLQSQNKWYQAQGLKVVRANGEYAVEWINNKNGKQEIESNVVLNPSDLADGFIMLGITEDHLLGHMVRVRELSDYEEQAFQVAYNK